MYDTSLHLYIYTCFAETRSCSIWNNSPIEITWRYWLLRTLALKITFVIWRSVEPVQRRDWDAADLSVTYWLFKVSPVDWDRNFIITSRASSVIIWEILNRPNSKLFREYIYIYT